MKVFFQSALFLLSFVCDAQIPDDYELLNSALPNLTFVAAKDTIQLYEKPITFEKQKEFFTKESFKEFTFPTAGVDSKKVKKLMCKIDFNYLANQKGNTERWDFEKFKINIRYSKPVSAENRKKQYAISAPVYTKDGNLAFIYYSVSCYMDCGNTVVKAYKKVKGKWVFYVQFPLTVS